MSTRKPSLGKLFGDVLRMYATQMHVALPGKVESYDASTQTASIKPMVKQVTEAEEGEISESLPVIPNVPIAFPRAGGFFVSFPVAKGDTVLLVFCDASIDEWRATDKESEPGDLRKHTLSGAVAIPGVYANANKLSDAHDENMVMGEDGGGQIHIKPNGEVHLGSEDASDWVALADLVKDEISGLRDTVNSFVSTFNGHIHTGTASCSTGGGAVTLAPPTSSASPPNPVGDVAASKVKAD